MKLAFGQAGPGQTSRGQAKLTGSTETTRLHLGSIGVCWLLAGTEEHVEKHAAFCHECVVGQGLHGSAQEVQFIQDTSGGPLWVILGNLNGNLVLVCGLVRL